MYKVSKDIYIHVHTTCTYDMYTHTHTHTRTHTHMYIDIHRYTYRHGRHGDLFSVSCPQGRLSNVGDMTDADAYNHSDDVFPAFLDNIF